MGGDVKKLQAYLRLLAAALGLALLFSCARKPLEMVKHAEFAPADSEAAWARYHWYAVDYTYEYNTSQYIDNGYESLRSYSHFQLIAKVLTPEGSQVGTIPLKGMAKNLMHLEVELYDSSGGEVPLDRHVMDSVFQEKEILVLPRVTAGCVIAVHIQSGPFGVFNYWDLQLGLAAPIYHATVRISYPRFMKYAEHEYNGLVKSADSAHSGKKFYSWRAENVLPSPDLPFVDHSRFRPTLVLVANRNLQGDDFPDWPAVAKYARKIRFDHFLFNRNGNVKKKARELAQGIGDSLAIARRLLEWTQDNISLDDQSPVRKDPDDILAAGRGTRWQIAAVLSTLYSEMDLPNDIVLTRVREAGGFDPQAPNPNAAYEPIVLVKAGRDEWAACPHLRWFGLGGYPEDCIGLSALSLTSGSPRELPSSSGNRSDIVVREEFSTESVKSGKRTLEISLDHLAAAQARRAFAQTGVTRETCGKFLAARGFLLAVDNCTESELDNRDQPLRLKVTANGTTLTLMDRRAAHVKIQTIWSSPAWFYDSARVAEYYLPYEQRISETILAKLQAREKLDVACKETRTPVFEVACKRKMESGKTVVTRETILHAGRFSAASLRVWNADLAPLSGSPVAEITQ